MTTADEQRRPDAGVLWQPSPEWMASANMTAFMLQSDRRWGHGAMTYGALHDWSIRRPDQFWQSLIEIQGIKAQTWGERVLVDRDRMPGARFFPDARLNFAENLLSRRGGSDAIVFRGEDKVDRRLSWDELHDAVSRFARALRAFGVRPGDRVAGFLPNMPEAVIAMLSAAAEGATWCSCSPDFGPDGVVDRFGQIAPRILVAVDGYHYGGRTHNCMGKLRELVRLLPSVEHTIVVPYASAAPDISGLPNARLWSDVLGAHEAGPIAFEQLPFDHPLYVMFSSGTTGAPKCIVHGAGGTLLKQVSEHVLHCDIRPGDRMFYFTTCSWMMWNWLVAGLASGATLLLYDGSPFHPDGRVLFDYISAERATFFGTSAKYIDALSKHAIEPCSTHDLSSLRTITSTGSPLSAESFDYVYRAIKADCHLASISGGTDILGCFVLGNPLAAVRRGEIQAPALGMAVDVFDEERRPVRGSKGELVCTRPFPSMPIGFWGDADGRKYRSAYFETYPGIWHHGDYAEITEHGGYVIHGRSDTTLNPGGVRIGTAEIYRQVEKFEEIVDSVVIGQDWQGDVRIVLFVVLAEGRTLDGTLASRISSEIRKSCTPRHVPARIIAVKDVPRTKSGKVTETAVRDIVHGRAVKNSHALANPQALELFRNLPELAS
jgi:acetoacetyl-CoA synthetase